MNFRVECKLQFKHIKCYIILRVITISSPIHNVQVMYKTLKRTKQMVKILKFTLLANPPYNQNLIPGLKGIRKSTSFLSHDKVAVAVRNWIKK